MHDYQRGEDILSRHWTTLQEIIKMHVAAAGGGSYILRHKRMQVFAGIFPNHAVSAIPYSKL